ncbi:MAG: DUF2075 domain-containing protein [Candidatus Baltobacteraceae bacterium]
MQLFSGPSEEFIDEAIRRRIAERLGDAFYDYYRFRASASEFNSWQNSLNALAYQLRYSGVRDHGVVLEMQLPLSSARLDAFVFGHSHSGAEEAVLLELKQWTEASASQWDGCVEAFVGGALRKVVHPCLQAQSYAEYLAGSHSAFDLDAGGIPIAACAWLHNMHPAAAGVLTSTEFADLIAEVPLFVNSDSDTLKEFFAEHVGGGRGVPVMERALSGKHSPSRKLLENTAAMIKGEPCYKLIDDQIIAYNAVLGMVRRAQKNASDKAIVAVHGGPGTGKSVIALNLLGTLSNMGVNVQHATGSKAFTENLWRILGSRSKAQVRYFNNFGEADRGSVDVILADEAHRIRETSNNRFTPKERKSDRAQVDELIEAAKVTVFFIDDYQAVRPGEVGSMKMIREAAVRHDARYESIDLRTQFRCAGSDEYIDWVDQLLEIRKTGVVNLSSGEFSLQLLDDPLEMERVLSERVAEGYSARLTAGYCWPWSDPTPEGQLIADIEIGNFRRPWNARPEARRLDKGIPPATFWATDPRGFGQVGCVYTAQGFEFDFAGVIWGPDLVIRNGQWIGQTSASRDHVVKTRSCARFVDVVKNTYRVLLTRGMRGAYLCVLDDETRAFIERRIL